MIQSTSCRLRYYPGSFLVGYYLQLLISWLAIKLSLACQTIQHNCLPSSPGKPLIHINGKTGSCKHLTYDHAVHTVRMHVIHMDCTKKCTSLLAMKIVMLFEMPIQSSHMY